MEHVAHKTNLFMKKIIILVFLLPSMAFLHAQNQVTLKAQLDNCSSADSFVLYKSEGFFRQMISVAKADANGHFSFKVPASATPQFYHVGLNIDGEKIKPILLGTEKEVLLTGGCYNMLNTVAKGTLNEAYDDARRKMGYLKIDANKASQNLQLNYQDANLRSQFEQQIIQNDKNKRALLDSLKKANPLVAKILALDTYTSFLGVEKKDKFKGEVDYFATQYFQYVDWKDAAYNNLTTVFDMFRSYAQVIAMPQLGLTKEQQKAYFDAQLDAIPVKSRAYKFALSGVFTALMEAQNGNMITYMERYLNDFPEEDSENKRLLYSSITQMKAQMLDVPAPEIVQADTMGKMRKLSDLKGKVVLIDFWASWCGPCRRENPTVVRLFDKYKAKGFDVFSVSLDNSRDRWIKAIKDDNLVWDNHVSDLQYWQNEAARNYGVSSIPNTLLLDKNGLIIARNLRGAALEAKLKELFGE